MIATGWLLAILLTSPDAAVTSRLDPEPAAAGGSAPEHGKAATGDASPVDPRVLEVEIGYAPVWSHPAGTAWHDFSASGQTHALAATLTYGVAGGLDVKVAVGLATASAAGMQGTGMGDAVVGARWRFLELPEHALEMAVTGEVVLPIGTPTIGDQIGFSQGFWSARGALVATRDLGRLTANAEIACAVPVSGDAGGLRSRLQANWAVGYQLSPWLQPELELNYQASLGLDSQALAATGGIVAPWGQGYRVVAAVQQGLWQRRAERATVLMLAFKAAL